MSRSWKAARDGAASTAMSMRSAVTRGNMKGAISQFDAVNAESMRQVVAGAARHAIDGPLFVPPGVSRFARWLDRAFSVSSVNELLG